MAPSAPPAVAELQRVGTASHHASPCGAAQAVWPENSQLGRTSTTETPKSVLMGTFYTPVSRLRGPAPPKMEGSIKVWGLNAAGFKTANHVALSGSAVITTRPFPSFFPMELEGIPLYAIRADVSTTDHLHHCVRVACPFCRSTEPTTELFPPPRVKAHAPDQLLW